MEPVVDTHRAVSKKEMTSLSQDADHYEKAFRVYIQITDRDNALRTFIEKTLLEGVVKKLEPVGFDIQPFTLKTLGVGCSSGMIDWTIMNQLSRRFSPIAHTVLEPYQSIEEYRALVERKPIDSVRTWDWRRQTWEQFAERPESHRIPVKKYHFISAISVVYYLHSWRDSLLDMHSRLEEGGLLLVSASTEDAGFLRAGEEFPALKKEGFSGVTSDLIKNFFASRGIRFTSLRQDHSADISCCFSEKDETGSLLLDFLTHVKDFENTSPKELVADFRAYLKSSRCSRQDENGGAVTLNIDIDLIIVRKEPDAY